MRRTTMLAAAGLLGLLWARGDMGGVAEARGLEEDDLAVVRRAVAQNHPPSPPATPQVEERAPARKSSPQWLRVRITEHGKKRVSVNLPLALARALGDDIPIQLGCRRHGDDDHERRTIRLGEVLKALDSGQDIVQVDSDEGTVRVWVE